MTIRGRPAPPDPADLASEQEEALKEALSAPDDAGTNGPKQAESAPPGCGDPFVAFTEWAGPIDDVDFADL